MQVVLEPEVRDFYLRALRLLRDSGVPFQVGGAYALARYTGVERHTKDLDVFVRPADAEAVLNLFRQAGYATDRTFPHWLGKVFSGDAFVDVIYRSGNGLAEVDDEWLRHGAPDEVLGEPVKLCPPEEILWSKAFVMERERFDGADVAHVLRATAERIDWERLVRRFGPHWRVLMGHLVLFGYIYPGERSKIPGHVLAGLVRRLAVETTAASPSNGRVCRGTFLSREQYLVDIGPWGYADARLAYRSMTPLDVAHWTAAIDRK
jgi:hypothetical protein